MSTVLCIVLFQFFSVFVQYKLYNTHFLLPSLPLIPIHVVTFHFLDDAIYQSAAGLLVIFRLWRFVRIGHAIVEVTNQKAHEEYNGLLAYTEALEHLLQQHAIPVPECQWTHLGGSSHNSGGGGMRHSDHNKNSSISGSSGGNVNILNEIEQAHRDELRQKLNLTTADPGADEKQLEQTKIEPSTI